MAQADTKWSDQERKVLQSVRMSKMIWPILIGVGVVLYLLYQQYDPEEIAKIPWTIHTFFWITMSILVLGVRHLAYANRLRILSEWQFSWRKCIQLIFIWEFSSAVSPTSVGGSAVALFMLAQEKLSTAKTTAIVLYTVVLDTAFFVTTLPILFIFLGPEMIRPEMKMLSDIRGWGITFLGAYTFMAFYGALFFYGLFISPVKMKKLLAALTNIRFLKKYKRKAVSIGNDFIIASAELKQQKMQFHAGAFLSTAVAWSCKFIMMICLIIGLVSVLPFDFSSLFKLFARLEAMFVIMAFSPTPGGAGFAEFVFGGFLRDFVPAGIALIVAFMWRLISYYAYLLAGAIIIPGWLNRILLERRMARKKPDEVVQVTDQSKDSY